LINLESVDLICIETREPDFALIAIDKTIKNIKFRSVKLVTNPSLAKLNRDDIQIIEVNSLNNIKEYSGYVLNELSKLVEGTHALIIQWDSFVINANLWDRSFLEYDYIGAPWPHNPKTPVGNGGFSLRSKKLIDVLLLDEIPKRHPEDICICIDNRSLLENKFEIKFADEITAQRFSIERGKGNEAFGFHGFFNFARFLNYEDLEQIIQKIPSGLMGGIDTYDLIKDLERRGYNNLIKELVGKNKPRKKNYKKFIKYYLKYKIVKMLSFLNTKMGRKYDN